MARDEYQTKADAAVLATLDAIATMPGLSVLIGFGSPVFDHLVDAAAAGDGIVMETEEHRRLYWIGYLERRQLKRN